MDILYEIAVVVILFTMVISKVGYIQNPYSNFWYNNFLNRMFEEKLLTFKNLSYFWSLALFAALIIAIMFNNKYGVWGAHICIFISLEAQLLYSSYYAYCKKDKKSWLKRYVGMLVFFVVYFYWFVQIKTIGDGELIGGDAAFMILGSQLIIQFFDPDRGSLKKWLCSFKKVVFSDRI